jgi:NMD protein affecting ribosome stability and mRNA decay
MLIRTADRVEPKCVRCGTTVGAELRPDHNAALCEDCLVTQRWIDRNMEGLEC